MKNSKAHLTNLTMGWIDYRKAYDMVPHTQIHECLEMYKVDEKIRHMIRNSVETWRTVLECNGSELEEVNIRKGIFKGNSLSPRLFVIAMIPLTRLKYEELKREIYKRRGVQKTVIPIIIGALGTITDSLTSFLVMVGVSLSF